jgi:trehalose 6-phosphate synthase/phosphatase
VLVPEGPTSTPITLDEAFERARTAEHLRLLLDYDGTLVPLVSHPELAQPPTEVIALLCRLGRRRRTEVHVVSGRPVRDLDRWLGDLPVALHAEHGAWSRVPLGPWRRDPRAAIDLEEELVDSAVAVVSRTPGAFVEVKSAALAIHYRQVPSALVEKLLSDIRYQVMPFLPAELRWTAGAKVVELRPRAVHKGQIAQRVAAVAPLGAVVLAAGDDVTDEDMFCGLPDDALTVKIGTGPSRALVRADTQVELLAARSRLADG